MARATANKPAPLERTTTAKKPLWFLREELLYNKET